MIEKKKKKEKKKHRLCGEVNSRASLLNSSLLCESA